MPRTPVLIVGGLCLAALAGATVLRGELRSAEGESPATGTPAAAIDSIASPAGPGAAEPNLDVGADGRVYMSWI